jgi:O-succinylhomoserine sulfhydrylase
MGDKTKSKALTQVVNGVMAILSRGDLAGRLAATLNKWLKRPGACNRSAFAAGFFVCKVMT